ncbi:MAG TPA: nicotinate phosphoribosyltransferase [Pirellulales bacterium]|jgi:nicotinate phosphoribosyltransferase|nr:nicotinate phosphoribosyltransferase [Pirellulales bacterium]
MSTLGTLYRCSLGLLTDLYELTMAYGYWKIGNHDREAVFQLVFRKNPFGGGFTVAAGLATVIEFLERMRFDADDLIYLAGLRGNDDRPLFEPAFLEYLGQFHLACDVHAVPEGTVVFPHEPLVRVQGPLIQAQLLETALLNIINFQSLVATKAARVVLAARGEPVLEFGLRRAQGIDGGLAASRAAYLGGCDATSNVLAGRLYGIPVKGTHAHSWVMSFDNEVEAFRAYARTMPNNCVFLVDTYNSLEGVRHAIEVGRELRRQGHEMIGIRLDSGDFAWLSVEARRMLDDAGFPNASILASNELDEQIIASLKEQGAAINAWGVGTRLVTAYDQPALGGVYKLSVLRDRQGRWQHKVKLSEQAIKVSTPGILQVRRFQQSRQAIGDVIFDELTPIRGDTTMVDPLDPTRRKVMPAATAIVGQASQPDAADDLLVPIFSRGKCVYRVPSLEDSRRRLGEQLAMFHAGVKRFVNPHRYPVGLELGLHELKTELILKTRGLEGRP